MYNYYSLLNLLLIQLLLKHLSDSQPNHSYSFQGTLQPTPLENLLQLLQRFLWFRLVFSYYDRQIIDYIKKPYDPTGPLLVVVASPTEDSRSRGWLVLVKLEIIGLPSEGWKKLHPFILCLVVHHPSIQLNCTFIARWNLNSYVMCLMGCKFASYHRCT